MTNSGFVDESMVKIDNILIVKTLDNTLNFPNLEANHLVQQCIKNEVFH